MIASNGLRQKQLYNVNTDVQWHVYSYDVCVCVCEHKRSTVVSVCENNILHALAWNMVHMICYIDETTTVSNYDVPG